MKKLMIFLIFICLFSTLVFAEESDNDFPKVSFASTGISYSTSIAETCFNFDTEPDNFIQGLVIAMLSASMGTYLSAFKPIIGISYVIDF